MMNRLRRAFSVLSHDLNRVYGLVLAFIGLRTLWAVWSAWLEGRWGWGEIPFLGWYVALGTTAAGVAFACRLRGSREFAILQSAAVAGALTWLAVRQRSFDFQRLLTIGGMLWIAHSIWMDEGPEPEEQEDEAETDSYPALILLRTEPMFVDAAVVARFATRAFGVPFTTGMSESATKDVGNVVVGSPPQIFVAYDGLLLRVHIDDVPMEGSEGLVAELGPTRLADAISRHRARIGVVVPESPRDAAHARELYRLCGRLVAEFFDDDCVAIVLTEDYSVYLAEPGTEQKLRSDDPAGALRSRDRDPIVFVESDDPDMQAAVAEARARWPEFVAEFERRAASDEVFSPSFVKVPFAAAGGDGGEFMWLKVTALEGESVFGVLDNDPGVVPGVASGDRIRKSVSDVSDWMWLDGEEMRGGFSIQALQKIQARRRGSGPAAS